MTRKLVLLTLALWGCLCPALAPAQDNREELLRLDKDMMAAYDAKDFDKAIAIGKQLIAMLPNPMTVEYNLACIHSLRGEREPALDYLRKAADHGFAAIELVKADKDLAPLASDPSFQESLRRMEANLQKNLDTLKQRVESVEPLVFTPEGLNPRNRVTLIVVLHGYGATAADIIEAYKGVAKTNGAIVVAPQALRPAGKGFDWGTSMVEIDMIVNHAITRVSATYNIDPARVVLSGFSQGGFMAYNLVATHPDKFCGAIPVAARYSPRDAKWPAEMPARLPRVYIMTGKDDQFLEENRTAAKDLEARKIPFKMVEYLGVGHAFPPNREEELNTALEFVLKKE